MSDTFFALLLDGPGARVRIQGGPVGVELDCLRPGMRAEWLGGTPQEGSPCLISAIRSSDKGPLLDLRLLPGSQSVPSIPLSAIAPAGEAQWNGTPDVLRPTLQYQPTKEEMAASLPPVYAPALLLHPQFLLLTAAPSQPRRDGCRATQLAFLQECLSATCSHDHNSPMPASHWLPGLVLELHRRLHLALSFLCLQYTVRNDRVDQRHKAQRLTQEAESDGGETVALVAFVAEASSDSKLLVWASLLLLGWLRD